MLRRQLPAHSPICLRGLLPTRAGAAELGKRVSAILCSQYEADEALLYGGGTQALQAAIELAATSMRSDAPVALPAFSCFDVATAAVGAGRRIVLYDVDPSSLGPDLASLQEVLRAGANIVVVAPLYGVPIDWEGLQRLLGCYGALAIEDAAQGHGASWRGRRLGSLSPLSVLSFGRGKGWTAGRGGALLLRRGAHPANGGTGGRRDRPRPGPVRELTVTLAASMQWGLARPVFYAFPASIPWLGLGETRYRKPRPLTAMTAAAMRMLLATQKVAELEAESRRLNARSLLARLPAGGRVRAIAPPPGSCPGYLRLPVLLSAGMAGFPSPEEALRLGIAPSYPTPLSALPAVQDRLARSGDWPGARALAEKLITLPVHSHLTREDETQVLHLLNNYGGLSTSSPRFDQAQAPA